MAFWLEVFLLASVAELGIYLPLFWRVRSVLAVALALASSVSVVFLAAIHLSLAAILVLILTGYRVFNLFRILKARMNEQYMRTATLRTSTVIIAIQIAILGLDVYFRWAGVTFSASLPLVVAIQAVVALGLLWSTLHSMHKLQPPQLTETYTDNDLPTLTVCIPARNETESLEECLETCIASDYPKLEIIVLDDCSQTKRTPEIIRSFAHDGVKFVLGEQPSDSWLAKNYAYQQLFEQSNGDIVVFCGVDVRFSPGSLRHMVELLLSKRKDMISFIPRNAIKGETGWWQPFFFQPARYAWEVVLPRKVFKRPPVLSTCWVTKRSLVEKAGGFAAVSRSIVPESYFARVSARNNDGYSFLISDPKTNILSCKSYDEQKSTAIRVRYPQLHKRPEQIVVTAAAQTIFLVMPFVVLVYLLVVNQYALAIIATLACVALIWSYILVVELTYRKNLVASVFLMPFVALFNVFLLHYSMWKYEFSEVVWKGRNVCIPVLRAIPKLPSLDN